MAGIAHDPHCIRLTISSLGVTGPGAKNIGKSLSLCEQTRVLVGLQCIKGVAPFINRILRQRDFPAQGANRVFKQILSLHDQVGSGKDPLGLIGLPTPHKTAMLPWRGIVSIVIKQNPSLSNERKSVSILIRHCD